MDISFTSWERRRRHISPEPERILPLLKAAGTAGMTGKQLGAAVELDRDVLDELLAGLVSAGLLTLVRQGGGPVYRATTGIG